MTDRITANLPSRDLAATAAFCARPGFDQCHRGDGWMILRRGATLPEDARPSPRLTGFFKPPGAPRRLAPVDEDGSLLRVIDNGDNDVG
jgi:hypothetical protein